MLIPAEAALVLILLAGVLGVWFGMEVQQWLDDQPDTDREVSA